MVEEALVRGEVVRRRRQLGRGAGDPEPDVTRAGAWGADGRAGGILQLPAVACGVGVKREGRK